MLSLQRRQRRDLKQSVTHLAPLCKKVSIRGSTKKSSQFHKKSWQSDSNDVLYQYDSRYHIDDQNWGSHRTWRPLLGLSRCDIWLKKGLLREPFFFENNQSGKPWVGHRYCPIRLVVRTCGFHPHNRISIILWGARGRNLSGKIPVLHIGLEVSSTSDSTNTPV